MIRLGFEWQPRSMTAEPAVTSRPGDPNSDLSDEEYAETHGFGVYLAFGGMEFGSPLDSENPNESYLRDLSDLERQAWQDGVDDCTRESWTHEDALFELTEPFFEADLEVMARLAADPRMLEQQARWSQCMADVGFAGLSTQDELITRLIEERAPLTSDDEIDEFRQREITLASESLGCRQDLERVRANVRRELEQELLDSDPRLRNSSAEFQKAVGG